MAAKDLLDRIIFPRSRNQKVINLDEAWIFDFEEQQLYVNGVEVGGGGGLTDEGARDLVAGTLVAGTGITIDVDDPGDTITINASAGVHDHDTDYVQLTGNETIAGVKTFSSDPIVPAEAYGVGWNGSNEPPTKNDVYDKIETMGGGITLEQVYDALGGGVLVAGNNIDITHNDALDTITIDVETLTPADIGTTASVAELDFVDGVTSAIQTQINTKAPTASPTFTGTVTLPVGLTGVIRADTGVVSVDTDVTDLVSAASDIAAGKVELATTAETTTGTDATRAVTPDGLHDMTSLAGAAWFVDEDAMTSNLDTKVPSQQSVKAYADTKQPIDTDLTTIAGLTATSDNFMVANASAWASRTPAQALVHLGITSTAAELNFTDGVTSAIQTQMDLKAPKASPTFTGTVTIPVALTGVVRADSGVLSVDTDVTDIVAAATTTAAGKVELATDAETNTGTDTTRAITPSNLEAWTGSAFITTVGTLASPTLTTPTISATGFTNANHAHIAANSGGTLDAAAIASGLLANARIATGTPNGAKFLRDDQVWTAIAAGGDVAGPAASVDSELVLYSGTTGKIIKRASGTGVIRTDSGVVSVDSDVTDIVSAATTILAGKVELATDAETNTGTDTTRAITPSNLEAWTGSAFITTVGTLASPVLTTPTIASFTNATHGHTDAASGGALLLTQSVALVFGDGTNVITVNDKRRFSIPVAHTLVRWRILSSISGSIVFDVWRDTYANYPPVVGDSISTSKPTLTTATNAEDSTITDWTEVGAAGDVYIVNVDSVTSCVDVTLELWYTRGIA